MATVQMTTETLTVQLARREKIAGLLRDLTVPLGAVTDVEVVPDGAAAVRGLRAPGLGLPSRRIGTWRRRGERSFVSVRGGRPALRLRLTGQRFDTVLVGLPDPAATAAELTRLRPVG
ncbi:hypothetical protein [Modestobacter lapidis]|nr:hypothetical protein [Modestobacter lapidis]